MRETPEAVQELQRRIDTTMAKINPHFAAIVTPKRRLTAQQVVTHLQGTRIVAFATVSPKGEPRVSPLDSLFIHGRFTLLAYVTATRIGHLRANPACSGVYMETDKFAVVANGTVEWLSATTRTTTRSMARGRRIRIGPLRLGRRHLLPNRAHLDVGLCLQAEGVSGQGLLAGRAPVDQAGEEGERQGSGGGGGGEEEGGGGGEGGGR